jgi:hypothetical protein
VKTPKSAAETAIEMIEEFGTLRPGEQIIVSGSMSDSSTAKWPFGTLRPFSYDVIMIDPPWDFVNQGGTVFGL